MDNVTHSLIGIALGRSFYRNPSPAQNAAVWTAVLGSNLPDLDFLIRPFTVAGNLGYLLHHRGYTHTVLAAFPLGIIAAAVGIRLAKARFDLLWKLGLLGILAVFGHIAADYCNNYGVHPFYPFLNHWYYGDFLFIVEPSIWFLLLPFAFFTARSKWGQRVSFVLGLGLLLMVLSQKFNPGLISLILPIVLASSYGLHRKLTQPWPAWMGVLFILGAFVSGSNTVKDEAKRTVLAQNPGEVIRDVISAPAPGNPFCWLVQIVSSDPAQDYVVRSGVISLLPSQFNAQTCFLNLDTETISKFQGSLGFVATQSPWVIEFRRPLSELEELTLQSCQFQNFLKFARAPFWVRTADGSIWAGDLRYARDDSGGFTRVSLDPAKQDCPTYPPAWVPPLGISKRENPVPSAVLDKGNSSS